MFTSHTTLGSVLIYGGNKGARLGKAWELLSRWGFKANTQYPDLLVVRKESERKSIGIAQVREIKDFMKKRPFEKEIKAVLVEDAQLLTDDAQGSLLKVLEEPPSFGLVILLVDKEGSLLPTVVSRCQKVAVTPAGGLLGIVPRFPPIPRNPLQVGSTYDIARLGYRELFDLAADLSSQGKSESVEFLENVLRYDIKSGAPYQVVQKMEKSIKSLREANAALKFALEYLFLLHKIYVW